MSTQKRWTPLAGIVLAIWGIVGCSSTTVTETTTTTAPPGAVGPTPRFAVAPGLAAALEFDAPVLPVVAPGIGAVEALARRIGVTERVATGMRDGEFKAGNLLVLPNGAWTYWEPDPQLGCGPQPMPSCTTTTGVIGAIPSNEAAIATARRIYGPSAVIGSPVRDPYGVSVPVAESSTGVATPQGSGIRVGPDARLLNARGVLAAFGDPLGDAARAAVTVDLAEALTGKTVLVEASRWLKECATACSGVFDVEVRAVAPSRAIVFSRTGKAYEIPVATITDEHGSVWQVALVSVTRLP